MKNKFQSFCFAAATAAAVLLSQSAGYAAHPHRAAARGFANTRPEAASQHCIPGNPNPRLHPPCSKPYGKTAGQWSEAWWQWLYSIPLETNPQLAGMVASPSDPAVEVDCSVGQSGPVWFLAANFGGVAKRKCKDPIPQGVSIFFPVSNIYFGVIGFDCVQQGAFPAPYPFLPVNVCSDNPWLYPDLGTGGESFNNYGGLVNWVAAILNDPGPMAAEIDGVPVHDLMAYRAQAPAFPVTTPSHNILGFVWPGIGPYGTGIADTYYPNGSDGYWLMTTPLPRGPHTVRFSWGDPPWLEVSYEFTVGPGR